MSAQSGRNDLCPCGSGKKYKKCCAENPAAIPADLQAELGRLAGMFHNQQYDEVEMRANLLLKRFPNQGLAWKILGTAMGIQGKDALPALQRAAALLPNDAMVHNNLGNAFKDHGRYPEAVASYRRVLELQPRSVDAQNNLGLALTALGDFSGAIGCYRQALIGQPDDAEIYNNLGVALKGQNQIDEAIQCYRKALALDPAYAQAHNNLGNVLQQLEQFDAALASYRRAIDLAPEYAEAHNNLGTVLKRKGQLEAAVASYRRALALKPDFAEGYYNLGNALRELGLIDAAMDALRRALALNPRYVDAYNNLGSVLTDVGRIDDAIACYQQALSIAPGDSAICSNLLFCRHYISSMDTDGKFKEALDYGRLISQKVERRYSDWLAPRRPQRLRIGMVSADFRRHPVGYFLQSVLECLDPSCIELIAYPTNAYVDELTEELKPCFQGWKPIHGLADAAAARLLHDDGVHILLDLSGHTAHSRLPLFAYKPAPVQISWLGYFASTGVAEIDYLLADKVGVPEESRDQFTERVWYLPDTRLCFSAPQVDLPVAPLPALQRGQVTFGCFQNLSKIGDAVLLAWAKILRAMPSARLRLANKQLGDKVVAADFTRRLQAHGIDPARVMLHGAVPREDYLAAHAEVDVILDTFPYPGGTTTCEALWMGVPTLTLAGESLLARQGASLLSAAGLNGWIANSEAEYVTKAVAFASDLLALAALRVGLRQQVLASPLFDAPRFARNFEAALWGMWREKGLENCKTAPM